MKFQFGHVLLVGLLSATLLGACGGDVSPPQTGDIQAGNIADQADNLGSRPSGDQAMGAANQNDNIGSRAGGDTERDFGGGQLLDEGLSEERAQAIAEGIAGNVDYDYDADAQTLTITTGVDEAVINEAINLALTQSGLDTTASVDFTSGSMTVTLEDFVYEGQSYGTVTMTVALTAADCRVSTAITDVNVNGSQLPQRALDQINAAISDAMGSAVDEFLTNADLPAYLDWCVTSVNITESSANITVVFSW